MDSFKVPTGIAQDLLLIQNLVGSSGPVLSQIKEKSPSIDDISSSGSEPDSEDEIEAQLVGNTDLEGSSSKDASQTTRKLSNQTSASDEHDSSSDLDSDSDLVDSENDLEKNTTIGSKVEEEDEEAMMDEDDSGPSAVTASYFTTKNEVADASITIPDIEEVGSEERLELVGRIMNIIGSVVIIEGQQTELARGGSDRALDADTLLVFEDRKVLGYIFETFGPTTQPMYQVKFDSTTYPLNLEKVRISRQVYHVPQRSNFVFMRQIQAMKGSDASNMNDEEPAEHELEFSDDEAEAEHRKNLKKKRTSSRASSAVPSRQSTPAPSQMRDADMVNEDYFMSNNAYDEIGPYDLNYDAPISRPVPIPYDDPYADEFENPDIRTPSTSNGNDASALRPQRRSSIRETKWRDEGHRGRGRGRGNSNGNRGNSKRQGGRGGGGSGFNSSKSNPSGSNNEQAWQHGSNASFSGRNGVIPGSSEPQPRFHQQTPVSPMGQWPFQTQNQGMPDYGMPYSPQQQFVQPHINPRFAGQFGIGGMGIRGGSYGSTPFVNIPSPSSYSSDYPGAYASTEGSSYWSDQWSVPTDGNGAETESQNA